ncbi:hypothetical protein AGOR_G00032530 [Albula goreensis]|uniref:Uncharacterized protein n=1 Tax=Albula goreensis TaxID=1534307 RepID=A0A8T3DZN9_9TELE|nr:hypothetical protein AGOR_G00032530 [Albula goreensis]
MVMPHRAPRLSYWLYNTVLSVSPVQVKEDVLVLPHTAESWPGASPSTDSALCCGGPLLRLPGSAHRSCTQLALHGLHPRLPPQLTPSAPQATAPPSLESLLCGSEGPAPLSYVTLQEQRCVLSWFQGWGALQRQRFMQDLLAKAVPGKVCTLLDQLNTLQVKDRPPNILECQLRLWSQWFESWSEEERNIFLHALEEKDPTFVEHFYRGVAGTAGRD